MKNTECVVDFLRLQDQSRKIRELLPTLLQICINERNPAINKVSIPGADISSRLHET